MSEILKVQLEDTDGNVYYMKTDASNVFCSDGSSVQTKLNNTINKSDLIQDSNTNDTTKVVSAAVAKNIQDQINKFRNMTMLVATTKIDWNSYPISDGLSKYKFIMFCINDGNMSHFPPSIYPIDIFKSCNSVTRTAMLNEHDSIKCYACYFSDTSIGVHIGNTGRQVTVYGIE